MAKILVPLPDTDFDVTEVAVPWKVLTRAGHEVIFATERGGAAPAADPRLSRACSSASWARTRSRRRSTRS